MGIYSALVFNSLTIMPPDRLGIEDDLRNFCEAVPFVQTIGDIVDDLDEDVEFDYLIDLVKDAIKNDIEFINGLTTVGFKLWLDNIVDLHMYEDGTYEYGLDNETSDDKISKFLSSLRRELRSHGVDNGDIIILVIDIIVQDIPWFAIDSSVTKKWKHK